VLVVMDGQVQIEEGTSAATPIFASVGTPLSFVPRLCLLRPCVPLYVSLSHCAYSLAPQRLAPREREVSSWLHQPAPLPNVLRALFLSLCGLKVTMHHCACSLSLLLSSIGPRRGRPLSTTYLLASTGAPSTCAARSPTRLFHSLWQ
jgi:hypothetical protein